jgi:hypothetical protein
MTTIANGNEHSVQEESAGTSRREFLYYLGGASLALFASGTCGAAYWFTQKRLQFGIESGIFLLSIDDLSLLRFGPIFHQASWSWLANTEDGLIAFDARCVFDGAIIRWFNRFDCPACGSKFQIDGTCIEGPARRNLDRLSIEVRTPYGTRTTPPDGSPVSIDEATSLVLDTNRFIYGASREDIS